MNRLIKIRHHLPWQFKFLVFYLINFFLSAVYFIIRILSKVDSKKIIVRNYDGLGFGDNAKAIVNYIVSKDKGIKIVWLVNDYSNNLLPNEIRIV